MGSNENRWIRFILPVLVILSFFSLGLTSGWPGDDNDTSILDKQEVLERQNWWDNKDWDWYKEKIPFFEAPDHLLEEIYYYRWELMTKHLVYGSPETGYTFTEFMNRPFWSGTYGGISCPLGHQFYEVRWLKDNRIIDDFARYWFETPGAEPRSYSNWYGDSMWGIYKVRQDRVFLESVYPYMIKQYNGFVKEHYNEEHRMFMWDGMHDGMELNINGRQTDNDFSGGHGFRPTLNSYMYADLRALSKASALFGNQQKTAEYAEKAQALKSRVQEELWDDDREFFFHQFAFDEKNGVKAFSLTYETGKYAGNPHGREEIGFVPWQFNLPDPGYEVAWKFLMDEDYFYTDYGPTTTEQGDPQFWVSDDCCVWSGNSWPYATTQTLVAMANLLQNYDQDVIDKQDYYELLKIYAKTHHKDGRPYLAEAADPFTGSWEGHNDYYHSEHYLHSGYINNIITGLVGLRPRAGDTLEVNPQVPDSWDYFALEDIAYHGHEVSIVWDRQGTRYNKGRGLMLFIDGEKVASSEKLRHMAVPVEDVPDKPLPEQPINFAVNNGRGFYPHISASSFYPAYTPYYANDGNYWYHKAPANRWVSKKSKDGREWMEVDFGVERPLDKIKLYFLDDGNTIVPPHNYDVQIWKGQNWETVNPAERTPRKPAGHRANTVKFKETQSASKIRILMEVQPGKSVGLTELVAWGNDDLPLDLPIERVRNLAYNPDNELYPIFSVSYTHEGSRLGTVSDMEGLIPYNHSPAWSAVDSPNEEDWIEINFGPRKKVQSVDIQLIGNRGKRGAPEKIEIEYLENSTWKTAEIKSRLPQKPMAMALNTLMLEEPVFTNKIRVIFHHKPSTFAEVSEIMVWSDHHR